MVPGVRGAPGLTVTDLEEALLVPQELDAVTVIFPFSPYAPAVTEIFAVPCPELICQPAGTVHV